MKRTLESGATAALSGWATQAWLERGCGQLRLRAMPHAALKYCPGHPADAGSQLKLEDRYGNRLSLGPYKVPNSQGRSGLPFPVPRRPSCVTK
jgi:hypothetical protein